MIRKKLKNTHKNKNIQRFLERYKVPKEFISTTRKMISRGIVIGLFIGMIPMPFQMLSVLFMAPFLRFNVPVAFLMCWVTNPFTMPFIYYIEYTTGGFFLGIEVQNVQMSIEWFQQNLTKIVYPLYFGALFYAILISSFAYYFVIYLWEKSVYEERKIAIK